jgi:hypothetical protein
LRQKNYSNEQFVLELNRLALNEETLNCICIFKIFEQSSLKEIGKAEINLKELVNFSDNYKVKSLFFDFGNHFHPGFQGKLFYPFRPKTILTKKKRINFLFLFICNIPF